MPAVSVIIVTYNSAPYIHRCLEALTRDATGMDVDIIVADNCSHDNSIALVREGFDTVRILQLDENVGFGRACNYAAQHASGDYLLLLNPDTTVVGGAMRALIDLAKRYPEAGIWGGRTLNADGNPDPGSCGSFPSLWTAFCVTSGLARIFRGTPTLNGGICGLSDHDGAVRVDVVSGCMLLIARDVWKKLGGFDPAYFLYSEEVDLCRRAREIGARPVVSPAASVIHDGGLKNSAEPWRWILLFRGKVTYMKRHWRKRDQVAGLALLLLWALSRYTAFLLLRSVSRRDSFRVRARLWATVWQARRDWLKGFPAVKGAGATA